MNTQRVNVYIDGSNFYFGLKSSGWRKYYWIDIVALFESFIRSGQELGNVYYFSARPHDLGKSKRQDTFFTANRKHPKFNLVLGKYMKKSIVCRGCNATIIRHEEKETDVRIATSIVRDVVLDNCDISIIVSADSDLIPAIELVRELNVNHQIFSYFPPKRYSNDLAIKSNAFVKMERYEHRFKQAILPNSIVINKSLTIVKPSTW